MTSSDKEWDNGLTPRQRGDICLDLPSLWLMDPNYNATEMRHVTGFQQVQLPACMQIRLTLKQHWVRIAVVNVSDFMFVYVYSVSMEPIWTQVYRLLSKWRLFTFRIRRQSKTVCFYSVGLLYGCLCSSKTNQSTSLKRYIVPNVFCCVFVLAVDANIWQSNLFRPVRPTEPFPPG